MPRKAFTVEQIIIKLREIEVLCGQGKTIAEAVRQSDITEQTYYRWRKQYGGMKTDDAKRLKELEKENARLKRLVADLSLDNAILRDVNSKNFYARSSKRQPSNTPWKNITSQSDGLVGFCMSIELPTGIKLFDCPMKMMSGQR